MRRTAEIALQWEWLILFFILPILFFPIGWRALFLLVIPLLWLLRKIAIGYFFPPTPYDASLLILGLALLVSLAAVFDMTISFPKIAGLVFGIALFYAGVQYTREDEGRVYHLPGVIFIFGTTFVIVGLLASIGSSYYSFAQPALTIIPESIFASLNFLENAVNPNELAGIISWVIPLLLACIVGFWDSLWRSDRWWHKIILAVLILMLVFNSLLLVATGSRGGLLAVIAALLLMLAIRYRWGRWLLLLVFIATVVFGFYFDFSALLQVDTQSAVDLGLQGRLEIWSRALYGLADFPITGMGMNGFRYIVHVLYPLFTIDPNFDIGHAHNQLLQAGLDLGIPGLIAYLSIWILTAALLWTSWQRSRSQANRVLILGLCGSFTAGWIFGTFDAIALGARPGFLWWLLLALLVAVSDQVQNSMEISID